jgi:hypothetical protein
MSKLFEVVIIILCLVSIGNYILNGILDFYTRFKFSKIHGIVAFWSSNYGNHVAWIKIPLWLMLGISIISFICMII